MKAVMIWSGLCACICLASLAMRQLPEGVKGPALSGAMFLVTFGLLVKVCRGSR